MGANSSHSEEGGVDFQSPLSLSRALSTRVGETLSSTSLDPSELGDLIATCQICLDGVHAYHLRGEQADGILSCGHVYHRPCLRQLAEHAAKDVADSVPRCPDLTCRTSLTQRELRSLLGDARFESYDKKLFDRFVDCNPNLFMRCPRPKCHGQPIFIEHALQQPQAAVRGTVVRMPFEEGASGSRLHMGHDGHGEVRSDDERIPHQRNARLSVAAGKVRCDRCNTDYCAACRCRAHDGSTCEEGQDLAAAAEVRAHTDTMLQLGFRRCRQCRFWIQKEEGCNKMTCRCGYQFCHRCIAWQFPLRSWRTWL